MIHMFSITYSRIGHELSKTFIVRGALDLERDPPNNVFLLHVGLLKFQKSQRGVPLARVRVKRSNLITER